MKLSHATIGVSGLAIDNSLLLITNSMRASEGGQATKLLVAVCYAFDDVMCLAIVNICNCTAAHFDRFGDLKIDVRPIEILGKSIDGIIKDFRRVYSQNGC